jgi:hypothetical protein
MIELLEQQDRQKRLIQAQEKIIDGRFQLKDWVRDLMKYIDQYPKWIGATLNHPIAVILELTEDHIQNIKSQIPICGQEALVNAMCNNDCRKNPWIRQHFQLQDELVAQRSSSLLDKVIETPVTDVRIVDPESHGWVSGAPTPGTKARFVDMSKEEIATLVESNIEDSATE